MKLIEVDKQNQKIKTNGLAMVSNNNFCMIKLSYINDNIFQPKDSITQISEAIQINKHKTEKLQKLNYVC